MSKAKIAAIFAAAFTFLATLQAIFLSDDDPPTDPDAGVADAGSAGGGGTGEAGSSGAGGTGGGTGGTGSEVDSGTPPPPPPPPAKACPDQGTKQPDYYVCDCSSGSEPGCQPGNDSASGTSPQTPWRTLTKAKQEFNAMEAGQTLAFCRGGVVTHPLGFSGTIDNRNCRAGSPCVMRDYTPPWGGQARPKIVFTGVEADGDGFRFLNGGAAEHDEGYLIMGIDLRGPGAGRAFYFYNDADDVTLCDVALDNFRVGVHVAGNQPPATGSDGKHDRIVLRSSRVTNNTEQGWLGGCDGCAIEHSYFENNGFAQPVFLHNIYMGPGKGQRIVGNELYKSAVINGQCRAVSLVVHGIVEDLLIEDNLVREDPGTAGNGCWGIIVDAGYDTAETFKNVRIARNTVLHYGGVSIGVNACQDCVIENNVVVNNSYGGTHISVPDRPREAGDAEIERVTVRNNTVAIGGTSNGRGIALGGEGNGHVSVSNVVVYTGSDPNWQCASYSGAPARFATLSHNLCYGPSDPPVLDANYRPLPGSPLLGAGHPSLSAQVDRTGATRPAPPAVGAFEASP